MSKILIKPATIEPKLKDFLEIKEIDSKQAYEIVKQFHYLGDKKFLNKVSYGLMCGGQLVGVAVYGMVQGISSLKGWFGLDNSHTNIYELHRLVMLPSFNGTNATSFFLSRSLRLLKKEGIRAVISLADSSLHAGYIYQACNFKYYGLTDKKTDFYSIDGRLNPRGSTKDVQGVWLPRSRKHRYSFVFDKYLKVLYDEQPYPKGESIEGLECCKGTHEVYDKRFDNFYTCPKCTGKLELLTGGNYETS